MMSITRFEIIVSFILDLQASSLSPEMTLPLNQGDEKSMIASLL